MPRLVQGHVAAGYEAVASELSTFALADPAYSAQFCAYVDGRPVVDVWAGPHISGDSLQGVFSVTKGVAGVCIALLVEHGLLDLDAPVSRYWPEFAAAGKGALPVRLVLSHQAGLIGFEPQATLEEMLDHEEMAERVAALRPHWRPGAALGYHALTIGTICDELVRRVTGQPVAQYFRDQVSSPRDVDVHVVTPLSEEARVLDVLPPLTPPALPEPPPSRAAAADAAAALAADSLTGMAFNASASRLFDPPVSNLRAVREAGHAAVSATASARGLARLYAACTSSVDGSAPLLSAATTSDVSQLQAAGHDLVLGHTSRFATMFQKADDRLWYGSHQAFGHDGAGGAMGVADPWHRLAYGYVPRHMSDPAGADARGLSLARTVRACTPALAT